MLIYIKIRIVSNLKNKPLILSILAMVIIYFIFAVYSNIGEVAKSLVAMNLILLPLILLSFTIAVVIKGIRQYYLLKYNDIRISFKENLIVYIAGLSLIFTPGGIGGMVKVKLLKDSHQVSIKKTAAVVIMELYHEFFSWVTLIIVTLFFYNYIEAKIALIFGIVILVAIYMNFRYHRFLEIFKKLVTKLKFLQKMLEGDEDTRKSLYVLTQPSLMVKIWIITCISTIFEAIAIYLIFLSLGVKQLSIILQLQVYYTALLFGQITFLPNGIGLTDVSLIGMLVARKLDLALATSVVLLIRIIGIWFKTGIGLVALKSLQRKDNAKAS